MRTLLLIYFATLVQSDIKGEVKLRHARTLIRHGRSRVHFARLHTRSRDLVPQVIEAEITSELAHTALSRRDCVTAQYQSHCNHADTSILTNGQRRFVEY
ncbi:unnamed protein product [Pieris macdunnoughi]|uniref:Secreted protein n=1 Tax=Pieris macdunnoughi TaxID=345717 RepID=A0A821SWH2_9NEOP|nr:unnamed protein product [Pieris macdunnoughi]